MAASVACGWAGCGVVLATSGAVAAGDGSAGTARGPHAASRSAKHISIGTRWRMIFLFLWNLTTG
jgi:hypothetical protein